MKTIKLKEKIERHIDAVKCPNCKGYAGQVESTEEEIANKTLNCGRSIACCCIAFVCDICGTRIVGKRLSPGMD